MLSLDLVFLPMRHQLGFGPLAVAYAAANIASAIPLTPGGLGVIEVTLVAITAIAYLRLRLRTGADRKRKGKGKPVTAQPG